MVTSNLAAERVGRPLPPGIIAPFQPGISGLGLALVHPDSSDWIVAHLGTDRYGSSQPPPSATPPQPSNIFKSVKEDEKSLVPPLDERQAKPRLYLCWKSRTAETSRREETPRVISFSFLNPQRPTLTDIAVGRLMSFRVAHFARDIHVPEPTRCPSPLQLVPRLNEVSRLECLVVACGRYMKSSLLRGEVSRGKGCLLSTKNSRTFNR